MKPLHELPARGRLAVDTAPIIYLLEDHPQFAPLYQPIFAAAEAGEYQLVISTVSLAGILVGPLGRKQERLAQDYRMALSDALAWQLVELSADIAHRAARIRGQCGLKLPDAIQVATALESRCLGLITHDRDFTALAKSDERLAVFSAI